MPEFKDIYAARASYIYALCCRLEAAPEMADRLYAEVWKGVYASLPEATNHGEVTVALCYHLANAYRRTGRRSLSLTAGPSDAGLSRLAPEYRLPLVLKEVGGLSYAGIAEALDVPPSTVRARLGRARTLLRSGQGCQG